LLLSVTLLDTLQGADGALKSELEKAHCTPELFLPIGFAQKNIELRFQRKITVLPERMTRVLLYQAG
jgi:hypothetical protein